MNAWKRVWVPLGACYSAFIAVAAWATPITYDFTVTATSGALAGTSSSGTFTYDSSSIPAILPGNVLQTGLLTDLAFVWDGISYDEGSANTGSLHFDSAGNLLLAFFGDDCVAGGCSLPPNESHWLVTLNLDPTKHSFFAYSHAGDEVGGGGPASITGPVGVPEPATLALLGLGLAGLATSRRRKQ